MKFLKSDGGRQFLHPHETSDCTVRSLAHAGQMSYADAHGFMKAGGRKDGKGGKVSEGLVAAAAAGRLLYNRRDHYWDNVTNTVKDFPIGNFIMTTATHSFAVVDGVLVDTFKISRNCRVRAVWHIQPIV